MPMEGRYVCHHNQKSFVKKYTRGLIQTAFGLSKGQMYSVMVFLLLQGHIN